MTTKITADNIQANAITVATIADGSVTLEKLESNVVTQIAAAGGSAGINPFLLTGM